MVERKIIRGVVRKVAAIFNPILTAEAALYGALVILHKKYPNGVPGPEWWVNTVNFIVDWGWIPAVLLVVSMPLFTWVNKKICPAHQERIISKLINDFFDRIKPDMAGDGNFRVTLFKYRRFSWRILFSLKWPFGEWLCPYERSGYQKRHSRRRWKVCMNKPNKNEGVAGLCFAKHEAIFIRDLPSGSSFLCAGAREAKKTYAKETNVKKEYLEAEIQRDPEYEWPRSFWGVKVFAGKTPWGVLLIDSTLPEIGDGTEIQEAVREYLKFFDAIISTS